MKVLIIGFVVIVVALALLLTWVAVEMQTEKATDVWRDR